MRIIAKTQTLIVFDLDKEECQGLTVAELKMKLENFPGIELTAKEQCLRYDGVFLRDEMKLDEVISEKGDLFFLTRLESKETENEPNEEEGAVGGVPANGKKSSDSKSILTDAELKDLALVPELDFSTDDELAAGVFDEDMELPPDLQQYYPTTVNADEHLVSKLIAMGYDERDACIALQASFNDPERAVEYLIDGIPTSLRSTLPELGDVGYSRTPPPSYTGSACSNCSLLHTPPTPHSLNVSTNCSNIETNGAEAINNALYENDGYDANDEAELGNDGLSKRKNKIVSKFKKRRVEIWAAKATIATAASNVTDDHTACNDVAQKIDSDLLGKLSNVNLNEGSSAAPLNVEEQSAEACSAEDANTVSGEQQHVDSQPKT